MGGKPFYIIRHVLPQTASYVIISAGVPGFIVAESVLSLIGLEFSSLTSYAIAGNECFDFGTARC